MIKTSLPHKRKFRFTVRVENNGEVVLPETFVKVSGRPSAIYTHDRTDWQDFGFTIYDTDHNQIKSFYSYLAKVYDFTNKDKVTMNTNCTADLYLTTYDGNNEPTEHWEMTKCWPVSINFGELDFSSSELCTLEINWRVGEAKWSPAAPKFKPGTVEVQEIDEIEIDMEGA